MPETIYLQKKNMARKQCKNRTFELREETSAFLWISKSLQAIKRNGKFQEIVSETLSQKPTIGDISETVASAIVAHDSQISFRTISRDPVISVPMRSESYIDVKFRYAICHRKLHENSLICSMILHLCVVNPFRRNNSSRFIEITIHLIYW